MGDKFTQVWAGNGQAQAIGYNRLTLPPAEQGVKYPCTTDIFLLHKQDQQAWSMRQYIRCRHCENCRAQRRAMWIARAIQEAEATSKLGFDNWLLTATCKRHALADDDYFVDGVGKAFKRMRRAGCEFRYLAIFERHKRRPGEVLGFPHAHILIHERKRIVHTRNLGEPSHFRQAFSWLGFIEAHTLVGEPGRAAAYVSKYMTKGDAPAVCRVRASVRYGAQDKDRVLANSNNMEFYSTTKTPTGNDRDPHSLNPEGNNPLFVREPDV